MLSDGFLYEVYQLLGEVAFHLVAFPGPDGIYDRNLRRWRLEVFLCQCNS